MGTPGLELNFCLRSTLIMWPKAETPWDLITSAEIDKKKCFYFEGSFRVVFTQMNLLDSSLWFWLYVVHHAKDD